MSNYNVSGLSDSNNLLDVALAVNVLSGEIFFTVVTVMILMITFIAMKRFDTGSAFVSSSFITLFLTAILWSVGLVAEAVLIVYFILFVLGIAITMITR